MGDWGKRIKVVFGDDGYGSTLYDIDNADAPLFRLVETNYNTYIYATGLSAGANPNELLIDFADFNQVQLPCTLEYLGGGSLRGADLTVSAFNITPSLSWWELNRKGDYEFLEVSSIEITGRLKSTLPVDYYMGDEHLEVTDITITGEIALCDFHKGYDGKEYLEVSSIVITGTYADANGIPV